MQILKDALFYLKEYGFLSLLRKIPVKLERSARLALKGVSNKYLPKKAKAEISHLAPIQIFTCPGLSPRVNLVLEQGTGTNTGLDNAIIFSVMAAIRWDYDLRIIADPPINMNHFHVLLISAGIHFRNNAEIISSEPDVANKEIDVCNGDIFITTSCLATHKVIGSINESRVIYLVQEDERTLYQNDGLKNLCSGILSNGKIYFLVKSRKLYDGLLADGLENIRGKGAWFEGSALTAADSAKNIAHEFNEIIQKLGIVLKVERADVRA